MGQIVSENLKKLFNSVELRLFVLVSLFLQIVLIAIGSRRKYTRRKRVAATVWVFYLSADFVATTSLGFLSRTKEKNDPRDPIRALWAPFLLMHLGGPDTITAYALADNELWLRHALGLVGQVLMAFYVLARSWNWTALNYLWIAVFVAGLIKCLERTWVLFSASRHQFRDSMVTPPDPGPNYAKFTDELVSREMEGYIVSVGKIINDDSSSVVIQPAADVEHASIIKEATLLHEAYYFYNTFKKLFVDLVLSIQDKEYSFSFFNSDTMDSEKAFSIVEIELGLIYDLLYTKAFIIYSQRGIFFRAVTSLCSVVSFIIFVIIHLNLKVLNDANVSVSVRTEMFITYVLLVGAIFLEFYAVVILVSSDRAMIWLSTGRKLKRPIVSTIYKTVSFLRNLHIVPAKKRWSNVMGQYNFLDSCFESKPKCSKLHDYLEKKYFFWKRKSVPHELKTLIFTEIRDRVNSNDDKMKVGSYKGGSIWLRQMKGLGEDADKEVEFDRSLLLWHIATDLCYYNDGEEEPCSKLEICKVLSDYMMHLLIMSPFMLPSGIGKIRFQDTRAEAIEFFDGEKLGSKKLDACQMLGRVDTRLEPYQLKGARSKSVLFDACRLAKAMESSEFDNRKWDIILQAWVDMLTYAAAHCSWSDHGEKLGEGGELLTHVWLLMAHFGMTDHFQVSLEHVRAKLIAR